MPVFLAFLGFLLVYTLSGIFLERVLGRPLRADSLARELNRLSPDAVVQAVPRWKRFGRAFLHPPDGAAPDGLVRSLLLMALGGFVVGAVIFGSIWSGLFLALCFLPGRYYLVANFRRQRRELLTLQFKDALYSIASSLRTGASLNTAIERAESDLRRILAGQKQQPMVEELNRIIKEMQFGGGVEDALIRFRDRVALEDVTHFVNTALLCKARGGNLAEVMATIAQIIGDKVSVRRQVQTLTAGKRMEATLLTSAPPAIVVVLSLMSPDYIAPLFSTLLGQALSALAVVLLLGAFVIGRKIVDIEV